ncbi:MAG: nucleoside triphosphate pyrophosphohydrolase [Alphaproteobacteria bacterium]
MKKATHETVSETDSHGLPVAPLPRLLAVMARLRDPKHGCPWDLKQTYATLARYAIEEAYEVADAAERHDFEALHEELGDLLLQVVFYGQLASEEGKFDFSSIAGGIADKLIRRHPHVFGDEVIATAEDMVTRWESDKAKERAEKAASADAPAAPEATSILDGIIIAQPALSRAQKLVHRSTQVGFDWPTASDVFPKLAEEISELQAELDGGNVARLTDELGDVLFTAVCLANKLKIDPETALRTANHKFERRFRAMEQALGRENDLYRRISLAEWEAAWINIKHQE